MSSTDCFFNVGPHQGDEFCFEPTDHVAGPWSPDFMHAGPPSALIAHVIGEVGRGHVPDPGFAASIHLDILRPIPVAPVVVTARVIRSGSRVALVEAELRPIGSTPIMLARAWVLRTGCVSVPRTPSAAPPGAGAEDVATPRRWSGGYLDAIEWSWVSGSFESTGPACVWARPRFPLIAGQELSAVERTLIIADSGSGISAAANPRELIFVNTDLSVHLRRPPTGEWLWMRSESWLDAGGVGLSSTILGDAAGAIGSGEQTLFLTPGPEA